jgi:hypothetical protein
MVVHFRICPVHASETLAVPFVAFSKRPQRKTADGMNAAAKAVNGLANLANGAVYDAKNAYAAADLAVRRIDGQQ